MSRNEEFEELQPLLLTIARRILGSTAEAEDAVNEAWLRYEEALTVPVSGKEFLSEAVTRISIGVLHSARVRRGRSVGQRSFALLPGDFDHDPQGPAESAESLSTAAVLLLERLSPLERAVFVLREIFGYESPEIASVVGCPEEVCEQLAATVPMVSGGGDTALPWPGRIVGAEQVARVLAAIVPALVRVGVTMEPQQVDQGPGAVFRDRHGRVLGALALDILDGRIQTIRWVTHPYAPRDPVADTPVAT
ncbi:sigma factor-like helix-turn-helix DNA-binding protein [Streptomyces sp. MZ04]|uniref:sigma factor-like helix-turn-helix DNA-binding protein n=1 Tax=Streptomyces sp. MZ04 TaxID=2559236 RepID=UPI00107EB791|nr:sigma factor-like helix-turn-helix DNA-binding protein [Streptomyces sp. MZ04]TGA91160.1 RNA polymerase subunit sigma-24 [Streptomyces sp. MZ04]